MIFRALSILFVASALSATAFFPASSSKISNPFFVRGGGPEKRKFSDGRYKEQLCSDKVGVPNPVYDSDGETSTVISRSLLKECLGEVTGTAGIIGFGTAACTTALLNGGTDLGVASCWAWIIAGMVSSLSHVCGAHFNPAISVATKVLFPHTMTWFKVFMYSMSQLIGATLGSAITLRCFAGAILAFEKKSGIIRNSIMGQKTASIFCLFYPPPNLATSVAGFPSLPVAVLFEIIGTGLLAFVAFSLGHPQNKIRDTSGIKPITIGFTVALIATVVGPVTMAGLNPARDLGPRLVCLLSGWGPSVMPSSGFLGSLLVYTLGPIVGACLGGFLAESLAKQE